MRYRIALALTAAIAAVGAPAAALASSSGTTTTRVSYVRPVDSHGRLVARDRVSRQFKHAQCNFGSEATGDAYRCFAGNFVLDPCWVTNVKSSVDCATSPWSRKVARLHVTKGYDNTGFDQRHPFDPWAVKLVTGKRCVWLQGATGAVHGKRISYSCGGRNYLIGNVHKHPQPWRIQTARSTGGGHFTAGPWVKIARAWYGKPSRRG